MRKPPANARYPHVCAFCDTPFVSKKRVQKFCSHRCCTNSMHDLKKIPKVCKHCGEGFLGASMKQYCSVRCRQAAKWRRLNPPPLAATPTKLTVPTYGFWGI